MSVIQEIKFLFLGILIWIPLATTIFPMYLLFYILRHVVHKLTRIFQPDLIPIGKTDSVMAFGPSNTESSNMYTTQVWKVKGKIDVEEFRNHFYHCFLATEEDRKKYVNLYCYFVEYLGYVFKRRVNSIDLKFHIRELKLPEGKSVEDFVGGWMVDHHIIDNERGIERPSWEIKVIPDAPYNQDDPGNLCEGRTTIVFKLHHGICDGYTIVHLAGKLAGQQAPYLFKEPEPKFYHKMKYILQMPYFTLERWVEMYRNRAQSFVTEYEGKENWLISFCTLDLETVKQIRRVTRTNFVSVLMSIQMGALKKLLREIKPETTDNIGNTYMGHSMGWPDHPVPQSGGGMTNHLTFNMIKTLFKIDDPLERLLDVDKNFRDTKAKGYPYIFHCIMFNMFKNQPGWFSRLLANGDFSITRMETGLSSLLCSSKQHYLLGHVVENLYLPVVLPSLFPKTRMMTVPVSHSGILDISINASTALVKDQASLDRLTQTYFLQELEALRQRCQVLFE
ncbi:hypothetical protein Ocin01_01837 [Orchesella cincta]|uniref:Uncharacterized protein n=1 Tax=Orchesella cincta TaxID=48709 RepID=A0A1D2NHZ3_ORCCI|nr:hypothetical protein Ocin01_01837 [Orchesella cincta]